VPQETRVIDDAVQSLLARWRNGDQQAADELFRRHADQLVAFARQRLSAKLAQRVDAEDVVQSAYRSFFSGARAGRYELERGGDLWRLLVGITLTKLLHQKRRNAAQKRDVGREQTLPLSAEMWAQDPTPLAAAALTDELEKTMRPLKPEERRMLEMRLQGFNLDEIAAETSRSVRTVRRVLEQVKQQFERSHLENSQA
jgi:RNA polymerase sigma factor (sigma-70 family)